MRQWYAPNKNEQNVRGDQFSIQTAMRQVCARHKFGRPRPPPFLFSACATPATASAAKTAKYHFEQRAEVHALMISTETKTQGTPDQRKIVLFQVCAGSVRQLLIFRGCAPRYAP